MDNWAIKVALSTARFVIGSVTANTKDNVFRFNIAHAAAPLWFPD